MRTHPEHLWQGVASRLLDHIIAQARARRWRRLSLETGSGPKFDPAISLYCKRGFVTGDPFGDYERNSFSQFLHLDLSP